MSSAPKHTAPRRSPDVPPAQPGRRNILGFGLIAAASLGGAGYFLWPALRQNLASAPAGAIPVAISMSGFAPNALTVKAGQRVDLQLINRDNSSHSDGGGWHQFAIDEMALDFKVAPLTEMLVSFTIDKPGSYDFYCNICCGGKANPYMHGTLIVEA